jgi:two-component system response regulator MprA
VLAGVQKILVVDDDPVITDFLRLGLSYEGYQVITAVSGLEGLNLAQTQTPDLIILDWMLPDMDGIEICKKLRSSSDVLIIMLTCRDDVPDRVEGLGSGADDYIVKPFHFEELLARMQALFRRRGIQAYNSEVQFMSLLINKDSFAVERNNQPIVLTPTEFKLLLLLAENPRKVFSKEQIIDRVWGYDYAGDINVVEVYIGYLRKKLGNPPLIHTVRGIGYVLDAPTRNQKL